MSVGRNFVTSTTVRAYATYIRDWYVGQMTRPHNNCCQVDLWYIEKKASSEIATNQKTMFKNVQTLRGLNGVHSHKGSLP